MTLNSFAAVFPFLILIPVLFVSFFRNYEVYGYPKSEKRFGWGKVGARLIGNEKKVGNTIIKKSPYDLLVWFDSDSLLEGSVKISELYLWDVKTKKTALTVRDTSEVKIEKRRSKCGGYFTFDDIEMDYSEFILNIKFVLQKDKQISEDTVEFQFKPEFKKFRRIIGVSPICSPK